MSAELQNNTTCNLGNILFTYPQNFDHVSWECGQYSLLEKHHTTESQRQLFECSQGSSCCVIFTFGCHRESVINGESASDPLLIFSGWCRLTAKVGLFKVLRTVQRHTLVPLKHMLNCVSNRSPEMYGTFSFFWMGVFLKTVFTTKSAKCFNLLFFLL